MNKTRSRTKSKSKYLRHNNNVTKLMQLAEEEVILNEGEIERAARRRSKDIQNKSYSKYLYHPASYFQRKSKDKRRLKKYNFDVTKGKFSAFPDPGLLSKGNRFGFENLGDKDRSWIHKKGEMEDLGILLVEGMAWRSKERGAQVRVGAAV